METFLRNKTFEVQLTLLYSDDESAINLDLLTEIEVEIKNAITNRVLVTKKLTTAGVVKITAASGICSVYINKLDTVEAEKGAYIYSVSVQGVNASYTGSVSYFAGFGNCFVLE